LPELVLKEQEDVHHAVVCLHVKEPEEVEIGKAHAVMSSYYIRGVQS
jgi:hypothetical protein